jgi:DUF1680 family protein
MRIPGWCRNFKVTLNGKKIDSPVTKNGYLVLNRKWKANDKIHMFFDMTANLDVSDPRVLANTGKRAMVRGPLVYCLEYADNQNISFDSVSLDNRFNFELISGDDLQPGLKKIRAFSDLAELFFIPYYAWDNREPGEMKVWIQETVSK